MTAEHGLAGGAVRSARFRTRSLAVAGVAVAIAVATTVAI